MHKQNKDVPQVVSPIQGQSTLGSDRMKAPVAHGSGEDSEGRSKCKILNKTDTTKRVTDTILDVPRRGRTASVSSAGSTTSCVSATDSEYRHTHAQTGQTGDSATLGHDERDLTELLMLIQRTATKMAEATAIQKNTSMTVKNGIKTILEAADAALNKRITTAPRARGTIYDSTETETETKKEETPRTKRKREKTGTTPEFSLKKTPREEPALTWQTVTKKRTKTTERKNDTNETNTKNRADRRSRVPNLRGTAVLVKPEKDVTYSDIIRRIRTAVDPTKNHVQVTTLRKTKTGQCLLKIHSKTETDGREDFRRALQDAVGDAGSVRTTTSKVQLEILDLDCVTTKEEVEQVLRRETGRDADFGVHIFGPNRAEQYMAVCDLEPQEARTLLDHGRIGIGWVRCRVRKRITVTKCYKCLGYGHTKQDCTKKDRTNCCRKCGKTGHYATDCKNSPACPLCAEAGHGDAGHLAGSGRCAVFRGALEECRRQARQRTK